MKCWRPYVRLYNPPTLRSSIAALPCCWRPAALPPAHLAHADVAGELGAALHVGQSERDAGVAAGEELASMGGTKAICVNHEVGNVALDLRCEGFAEGFGGEVTVLPTGNDPAEIESKVSAALASDEDVDTVMARGASLAGEPSVAAAKASGRDVKVASFDLSANFLQNIVDGEAAFVVHEHARGVARLPGSVSQFVPGYAVG